MDSRVDALWVWASPDGGQNFNRLYPGFSGLSAAWGKVSISLNDYVGKSSVVIAFQLWTENSGGSHQGWFLDNIAVIGGGYQPPIDPDKQSRADMIKRAAQDYRFGGAMFDTFGADLSFDPVFELRWMYFNVTGGRSAPLVHARDKSTGTRFTSFIDPDTGQLAEWQVAQ